MPWSHNDPDPLEDRRRQLAEQERLLAEQRKRLTEELHGVAESSSTTLKHSEPPVWRMEEDSPRPGVSDSALPRKRHLARQRRHDMVLFFLCIGVFLVVVAVVLWVAYVHNTAPMSGD